MVKGTPSILQAVKQTKLYEKVYKFMDGTERINSLNCLFCYKI